MTILIHFHHSQYRTFKAYYLGQVLPHRTSEFPNLVSYTRFVELMPRVLLPLLFSFLACRGQCTGISFFLVNLVCGLSAYCHQEKKPSITFPTEELALLTDGSEDMMILV
jgi:hypothetical protein